MTRAEIEKNILNIFNHNFEIESPSLDDDIRDQYGFDSIDAIELLSEIETFLGTKMSREEKENAFVLRTIREILEYIENLASQKGIELDA